jgi:hypothetical protein
MIECTVALPIGNRTTKTGIRDFGLRSAREAAPRASLQTLKRCALCASRGYVRDYSSCYRNINLSNNINELSGGDGGIRTLDTPLQAYNGLANRRLQPLGHVSSEAAFCLDFAPRARAAAAGRAGLHAHLLPGCARILGAATGPARLEPWPGCLRMTVAVALVYRILMPPRTICAI